MCCFLLIQEAASAQRGDEQPPATTAAAVAVLGMHKALARTLIAQTLPAPEPALRSRIDILVDIGSSEEIPAGFCMVIRLLNGSRAPLRLQASSWSGHHVGK